MPQCLHRAYHELVKLQHEETSGRVRVFERSGMRKDRYSSLSYNYYVAIQLETKIGRHDRHIETVCFVEQADNQRYE